MPDGAEFAYDCLIIALRGSGNMGRGFGAGIAMGFRFAMFVLLIRPHKTAFTFSLHGYHPFRPGDRPASIY